MTALLKPHITRLNGSSGSGTDFGSTTVAVGGFVFVTVCAPASVTKPNATTAKARIRNDAPGIMFNIAARSGAGGPIPCSDGFGFQLSFQETRQKARLGAMGCSPQRSIL